MYKTYNPAANAAPRPYLDTERDVPNKATRMYELSTAVEVLVKEAQDIRERLRNLGERLNADKPVEVEKSSGVAEGVYLGTAESTFGVSNRLRLLSAELCGISTRLSEIEDL